MTQKSIAEKVNLFQALLSLENYEFALSFDETSGQLEGAAEVVVWADYPRAEIKFAKDEYKKWSDEQAMKIVCHEMLHVVTSAITRIAKRTAEEGLGPSACSIVRASVRREDEFAVGRLTDAILTALET